MARNRGPLSLLWTGIVMAFILTGCMGGTSGEPRDFRVPSESVTVANPMAADESSLARGKKIFMSNCSECHGEEGRGDGPKASRLSFPPLDYRSDQVKALSDGELFYIITHGVEGSDMPAWGFFDDEDRWHLVNCVRTFQE